MKKQKEISTIGQVESSVTEVEDDVKKPNMIHNLPDGSILIGRVTPKELKEYKRKAKKELERHTKDLSNYINNKILEHITQDVHIINDTKWYDHYYK